MEQKPAGLDWDACLGWLPKIPWDPKRYFNRFSYWDFSTGGQTGGLFVHMVDVVQWYLGHRRGPSRGGDGRHLPLQRRARHAGQHQLRARISREVERDLRGHPHGHDPGGSGGHRLHGRGRPAEHLPLRLPISSPAKRTLNRRNRRRAHERQAHGQLARLHAHPPAAQRGRGGGALQRGGLPHRATSPTSSEARRSGEKEWEV